MKVRQVDRIDVSQSNLIMNIDDGYYQTERVKLSLYLDGQREELEPIYEKEGQVLIR